MKRNNTSQWHLVLKCLLCAALIISVTLFVIEKIREVTSQRWEFHLSNGYYIQKDGQDYAFFHCPADVEYPHQLWSVDSFCYNARWVSIIVKDPVVNRKPGYYLIDTENNIIYSSPDKEGLMELYEDKQISEISDWISTTFIPSGAILR